MSDLKTMQYYGLPLVAKAFKSIFYTIYDFEPPMAAVEIKCSHVDLHGVNHKLHCKVSINGSDTWSDSSTFSLYVADTVQLQFDVAVKYGESIVTEIYVNGELSKHAIYSTLPSSDLVFVGYRRWYIPIDAFPMPGAINPGRWLYVTNLNAAEEEPQYKWEKLFTLKEE